MHFRWEGDNTGWLALCGRVPFPAAMDLVKERSLESVLDHSYQPQQHSQSSLNAFDTDSARENKMLLIKGRRHEHQGAFTFALPFKGKGKGASVLVSSALAPLQNACSVALQDHKSDIMHHNCA